MTGGGGLGVCADWTVDVDRTVGGMDVGDGSCVSVPIGVKVPPLEAQPESIAQTTKRKWRGACLDRAWRRWPCWTDSGWSVA